MWAFRRIGREFKRKTLAHESERIHLNHRIFLLLLCEYEKG